LLSLHTVVAILFWTSHNHCWCIPLCGAAYKGEQRSEEFVVRGYNGGPNGIALEHTRSYWTKYKLAKNAILAVAGADGHDDHHVVMPGETLSLVARHYLVSLPELVLLNPEVNTVGKLHVGTLLCLPQGTCIGSRRSSSVTCSEFKDALDDIRDVRSDSSVTCSARSSYSSHERHVVEEGEYLGCIAAMHQVTVQQLLDANPALAVNPNMLWIGMTLRVPPSDHYETLCAQAAADDPPPPRQRLWWAKHSVGRILGRINRGIQQAHAHPGFGVAVLASSALVARRTTQHRGTCK
jgi:LysM repeat protein